MAAPFEYERLNAAIDTTPIVDNHAHPLLKPENLSQQPLLAISTEASGAALEDTRQSLSHIRAVKHLAQILGCEQTWEAVTRSIEKKRETPTSYHAWVKRCLEGIETILVDDGLHKHDEAQLYSWHDQFTRSKCKRIVRIEVVAEAIIARHCNNHVSTSSSSSGAATTRLDDIVGEFEREIEAAIADPEVAGFKSIVCYRGGLDIPPRGAAALDGAGPALQAIVDAHRSGRRRFERLEAPPLNHVLLHATAQLLSRDGDGDGGAAKKKPLQFHTGLGDSDITLARSSPAHLQAFVRDYPGVPVVLLHAGWPWTREAAYLAAVYGNVFLDVGEVFPMLGRHGQEQVVRQSLELSPWSKILWSTDGHWLPETYVLATTQVRSVLKTVRELVHARQLSEEQAVQLVQDVLFGNAQRLYNLQHLTSVLPSYAELSAATAAATANAGASSPQAVLRKLHALDTRYLRVYWHDYTSSAKCRVLPMRHVERTLLEGSSGGKPLAVSLTRASLGLLQNDALIPQASPSGVYALRPDWATLRPGPAPGHASCHGWFRTSESESDDELALCPRTLLRRVVDAAAAQGLAFRLGFEIEFVALERSGDGKYTALRSDDEGHAWSGARALAGWGGGGGGGSGFVGAVADEALGLLEAAGVEVEQFHAESAPGQFELALAPLGPLAACDALLHARQVVDAAAARHGFRVTLHPKPFGDACGSASHVHMSVSSSSSSSSEREVYEAFYAGILGHLRAVTALTCASPASYERVVDHCWAGGRWVAWGTQNREVPLRKVEGAHWEFKTLDGLANPYFAVAALLAAGADGVRRRAPLAWGDCAEDPALLSEARRAELNIRQMLPADLGEALRALAEDGELAELLGPEFVRRYIDVKNAELALLNPMSAEERRQWILERY
ncbi:hypothetical protein F4809DRAFT_656099 [Biscogniauxia mediterranea]|nr:hypothetical protein F4809DRAFT_656099 [Biscogniauxia mediterranea]